MTRRNEFDRKLARAMPLLEATGVSKRNYLPPMFPLYWRIGFLLPPPHFLSVTALVLVMGLPFGVAFLGLLMVMNDPRPPDPLAALVVLLLTTAIFGGILASYYVTGRVRFRLPRWNDL